MQFQIGKNGISAGIIESLSRALKNHGQVRISVLKSSGRNRFNIKEMAQEIQQKIPYKCSVKIIGFTIVLNKYRAGKLK